MSVLSVSVVVPVYNQAQLVGRTIAAVCGNDYQPVEIIVVNDGSTDNPHEAIQQALLSLKAPNVRVLDIPHGGPGRARDAGWRAAKGEVVAFTDADAIPDKEWISSALKRFVADNIGGVEGKIVAAGVPKAFTHQVKNMTGGRFMTANMFYRRSVIAEVGGFKSRYREDSDLAFSVLERGYDIVFENASVVFHPPREERWNFYFEKASRKRFEALLFRNHPGIAPQYIPRVQPTELLVIAGELLCLLTLVLGLRSLVAGLLLLLLGLPKRIAARLDGRVYSGRDYLAIWLLVLILVPVEAGYHWMGVLRPPR